MSYRVEYKASGNKFWKIIFAPIYILVLFARAFHRPIVQGTSKYPAHITLPAKRGWDE